MSVGLESYLVKFANDLEDLLGGRTTPEAFEAMYRGADLPAPIDDVLGWVAHFLSDADIRARDDEYREMQEREMQRLIAHVRAGRLDQARRITFLGLTNDA